MTSESPAIRRYSVGDKASFVVTIDADMVRRFVALTGDDNPVHVDPDYARATALGKPVVHGMLTASFVSTLIGKHLPGEGALWIAQEFNFRQPVRIGETLAFEAEVVELHDAMELLVLKVSVRNQQGQMVIDGRGKVKVMDLRVPAAATAPDAPGVALITGAGGGVGSACALALAKQGHPVILAANRSGDAAARIVDRIIAEGGKARLIAADLANEDDVETLIRDASQWNGVPRVLVHCAAFPITPRPALETRWKDMERHLTLAVRSFLALAQGLAPGMARAGGGAMIAISSQVLDEMPLPGWMGYTAAKAAMQAVAHSLAAELGPQKIRVNMVSPGLMETEFTTDVSERARLVLAQQTPLRRLCRPEDVAASVAFLAGPQSGFMTGETLRLSGGKVMT